MSSSDKMSCFQLDESVADSGNNHLSHKSNTDTNDINYGNTDRVEQSTRVVPF